MNDFEAKREARIDRLQAKPTSIARVLREPPGTEFVDDQGTRFTVEEIASMAVMSGPAEADAFMSRFTKAEKGHRASA